MPGRKRKPAALLKLHGHPGQQRPRNAEPQPPSGALACPREVRAVAGAERYWAHFLKFAPPGLLKPLDGPLLASLCIEHAMADLAQRKLKRNGHVITTSTGTLIQSPWVGIFHRSTEIARKLAAELGLSVTGRAKLEAPAPGILNPSEDDDDGRAESGDGLDKFLATHPDRKLH